MPTKPKRTLSIICKRLNVLVILKAHGYPNSPGNSLSCIHWELVECLCSNNSQGHTLPMGIAPQGNSSNAQTVQQRRSKATKDSWTRELSSLLLRDKWAILRSTLSRFATAIKVACSKRRRKDTYKMLLSATPTCMQRKCHPVKAQLLVISEWRITSLTRRISNAYR